MTLDEGLSIIMDGSVPEKYSDLWNMIFILEPLRSDFGGFLFLNFSDMKFLKLICILFFLGFN